MISDYFPETVCGSIVIVSEVPTDDVIEDLKSRDDCSMKLIIAKACGNAILIFLIK